MKMASCQVIQAVLASSLLVTFLALANAQVTCSCDIRTSPYCVQVIGHGACNPVQCQPKPECSLSGSKLCTITQIQTQVWRFISTATAGGACALINVTIEVLTEVTATPSPALISTDLQAFYRLSDTSDSSGNGNALTNYGGVLFSSGKIGNAAEFTGVFNQYLQSTSLDYSSYTSISICAWVKKTSTESGPRNILSTGTSGSNNRGVGLYADHSNGLKWIPFNNVDLALSSATFTNNTWFHTVITGTRSGGASDWIMYVNGSQIATGSGSDWFGDANKNGLFIGRSNEGQFARGKIDAVGIWSRALTPGEISSLYNFGAGFEITTSPSPAVTSSPAPVVTPSSAPVSTDLLAFYRLSDTSDSSGNGNILTNSGGVHFSYGKVGNAAEFTGVFNQYLQSTSLDYSSYTSISICAWVKKTSTESGPRNILSTGTSGSNNRGVGLYADHSNGLKWIPFNNVDLALSSATFTNNTWFHTVITGTRSGGASDWIMYVNGSQIATGSGSDWFGDANKNGLFIGRSNEGQFAHGKIDAVGIWSRALTPGEISALYDSGAGFEI